MEGKWTRLVHIASGEVSDYALDSMPPYVAVSHVWSEKLFPTGSAWMDMPGHKMILSLSATRYGNIRHCWVDTLCIDQDDEADKHCQIPLMGKIYSNAEVVAICLSTCFGFSQAHIDTLSRSCARTDSRLLSDIDKMNFWEKLKPRERRDLNDMLDISKRLTESTWCTRVWTAQEFMLAAEVIWIGSDLVPVTVNAARKSFSILLKWLVDQRELDLSPYSRLISHMFLLSDVKFGQRDKTSVMGLTSKAASVPEDQVYGLMAASGVVLEQTDVKGVENVWKLWWEQAISEGHLRWAFLAPQIPRSETRNVRSCIRPEFATRAAASMFSFPSFVESYGRSSIRNGTVSMAGRCIGICDNIQRLGQPLHIEYGGRNVAGSMVMFTAGTYRLAFRLVAVFARGYFTLTEQHTLAHILASNYPRFKLTLLNRRSCSFRIPSGVQATLLSRFTRKVYDADVRLTRSVFWLTTVRGRFNADIIIATNGQRVPKGAIAIDFGVVNDYGYHDLTILQPRSETESQKPFHRVGISVCLRMSTSFLKSMTMKKLQKCAEDIPLQQYSIGGEDCEGCRYPIPVLEPDLTPQNYYDRLHGAQRAAAKTSARLNIRRKFRNARRKGEPIRSFDRVNFHVYGDILLYSRRPRLPAHNPPSHSYTYENDWPYGGDLSSPTTNARSEVDETEPEDSALWQDVA